MFLLLLGTITLTLKLSWKVGGCFNWLMLLAIDLGTGFKLIFGCAVKLSVAPRCGEQPWPIATQYKLSVPSGSVTMSLSLIMNWLVEFMNCCTVGLLCNMFNAVAFGGCCTVFWGFR